jgi:hypothetical protein
MTTSEGGERERERERERRSIWTRLQISDAAPRSV